MARATIVQFRAMSQRKWSDWPMRMALPAALPCMTRKHPTVKMTAPSPWKAAGRRWSSSGRQAVMQARIQPEVSSRVLWLSRTSRQASVWSLRSMASAMSGCHSRVMARWGIWVTAAMKEAMANKGTHSVDISRPTMMMSIWFRMTQALFPRIIVPEYRRSERRNSRSRRPRRSMRNRLATACATRTARTTT